MKISKQLIKTAAGKSLLPPTHVYVSEQSGNLVTCDEHTAPEGYREPTEAEANAWLAARHEAVASNVRDDYKLRVQAELDGVRARVAELEAKLDGEA